MLTYAAQNTNGKITWFPGNVKGGAPPEGAPRPVQSRSDHERRCRPFCHCRGLRRAWVNAANNAGGQLLRRGQNGRDGFLVVLEVAQVLVTQRAVVGCHHLGPAEGSGVWELGGPKIKGRATQRKSSAPIKKPAIVLIAGFLN